MLSAYLNQKERVWFSNLAISLASADGFVGEDEASLLERCRIALELDSLDASIPFERALTLFSENSSNTVLQNVLLEMCRLALADPYLLSSETSKITRAAEVFGIPEPGLFIALSREQNPSNARINEVFSLPGAVPHRSAEPPLHGLDGKLLHINKRGALYPVDVTLSRENGQNILSVSARINFIDSIVTKRNGLEAWKKAVLDGFSDWSGNYAVLGGQNLTVRTSFTETNSLADCVFVFCIDNQMSAQMRKTYDRINADSVGELLASNRSFANVGNWKPYMPRFIYMLPHTLDNPSIAREVAKHEFGHVLGLGDMYREEQRGLEGVDAAQYPDIAGFATGERCFDMVMCNNGPVRNNDIEMVLLAFSGGGFQRYQREKSTDKLSPALGKGN